MFLTLIPLSGPSKSTVKTDENLSSPWKQTNNQTEKKTKKPDNP